MTEPVLKVVCFLVGERVFAADIRVIREILQPRPLTPVPGAPPAVLGVFNLRGELVPAVDSHGLLGERRPEDPPDPKIVVVRAGGRSFGLPVDRLFDVVAVPLEAVAPVPGAEDPERALVVGMFRRPESIQSEGDLVLLLRTGALLQGPGDQESHRENG